MDDLRRDLQADAGMLSEWHPSMATYALWMIMSVPLMLIGFAVYWPVALHGEIPVEWSISIGLREIVLVGVPSLALAWLHEGVHALVVLLCGARPQFGVLRLNGSPIGFYTTAPGHRFSRRQYLALALAPFVLLSPLGILACLLPFGVYLVVPFTIQLAGCIGDLTIVSAVLRGPSGALCEDLRDGTRFWPADVRTDARA